ncbi:hypothetical protein GGF46_003924 [Coemansia sp. RSA 552]|nr:hypothetical protein GGF46_003924 [Coemansia sp. RSA 552]
MDIGDTPYLINTFVEGIVRVTSYALTDDEKEAVVQGFRCFHEHLERMSSSSTLRQMAIDSQKLGKSSLCNHDGTSCAQNAIRGFAKAFLVGYGVKVGLSAVPHIISLRLFSNPRLLLRGFNRDTLSFATFLSAVIGFYKSILCTMRHWRGNKGGDYANSMVAGLLSGLLSSKLDRNRSQRNAITLYILSRALQYGTVWLFDQLVRHQHKEEDKIRSRWMKRAHSLNVLETTRSQPDTESRSEITQKALHYIREYAPTALMTFSVTLINYALYFHMETIPRGYANFLVSSGGVATKSYVANNPHAQGLISALSDHIHHDYTS